MVAVVRVVGLVGWVRGLVEAEVAQAVELDLGEFGAVLKEWWKGYPGR